MDLIRFPQSFAPGASLQVTDGSFLGPVTSVTWIERYREAGEFTITAPLSSNLRKLLPEGTLVSHMNSDYVMIVENHEITDEKESDRIITVSGRSFETALEQRVVGANRFTYFPAFPYTDTSIPTPAGYILPSGYTWTQARDIMRDHAEYGVVYDPNDALLGVVFNTYIVPPFAGVQVERPIEYGNVYKAVLDILAVDNLGIRALRRPDVSTSSSILLDIYVGTDLSGIVQFSYDMNDLDGADYLWSNKDDKNVVIVRGRWFHVIVRSSASNYGRRVDVIDASDLDGNLEEMPDGTAMDALLGAYETRGAQYLARKRAVAITKPALSKNSLRHVYRNNYHLGDIVTVNGNFGETAKMRVIEYVEIDDESGHHEYPTLENA